MTEDELIKRATMCAKEFRVDLKELPRRRIRLAMVVYFGSDKRNDHIEVCLDKETGEIISGTYSPGLKS